MEDYNVICRWYAVLAEQDLGIILWLGMALRIANTTAVKE